MKLVACYKNYSKKNLQKSMIEENFKMSGLFIEAGVLGTRPLHTKVQISFGQLIDSV
jgi:hypothetical protein